MRHLDATVLFAYLVSAAGSFTGLLAVQASRQATTTLAKVLGLAVATLSIGGIGIWLMHFVGMIGYASSRDVAFDLPITALSAGVALVVVGMGLALTTAETVSWPRLVPAGLLTGCGVAAMHYTGMAAMRVRGETSYDPGVVALSVVIAVVAATVALWFTVTVRSLWAVTGSAIVMGLAVCGMHYTGMVALTVRENLELPAVHGAQATSFVLPSFFAAAIFLPVALFYYFAGMDLEHDRLYADREGVDRLYRDPHGDRPHGDRSFGERPYGGRPVGDRSSGSATARPTVGAPVGAERPARFPAESAPRDGRSPVRAFEFPRDRP